MAVKLERMVKKFYDSLEEGKICGNKCCKCGHVEFPPVYACNECGSTDMEWYEISGKAKAYTLVLPAPMSSKPEYAPLKPYCYADIEIEEGTHVNGVLRGINKKKKKEIGSNLPVNCHASIYQADGYKTVVFDYDPE